jgi:hypothetical protein
MEMTADASMSAEVPLRSERIELNMSARIA